MPHDCAVGISVAHLIIGTHSTGEDIVKESEKSTIGSEPRAVNQLTQGGEVHKPGIQGPSRRNFLGGSSTALATAAFVGLTAHAQDAQDTCKAEKDTSASNPGQENKPLLEENPSSNQEPCANCTGMPMPANGSSGLPARDA
jgi:hypothetical protein